MVSTAEAAQGTEEGSPTRGWKEREDREVRYKNLYLCYKDRTAQHSPSR